MDEEIRVTRSQLEAALRKWDEQATAGQWPRRDDDETRHRDNANFLFDLLKQG